MSDEDTPNPAPAPNTPGVLPEHGISRIFILRPVATTLLTIGIALAGMFAFFQLPVAPLPQVDFPTISVNAQLPGASPDTVASSLASPLERHLGEIADVTEMTSTSSVGQTRITLQFGLDRDIDGAARDVEAAINAARADLPTNLVSNPTYRKVNPADAPVLILALTSKTLTRGQMYDAASNVLQQAISQLSGVGQVVIGGAAQPAVRVELNIEAAFKYGIGLEDIRAALSAANANSPKGFVDAGDKRYQIYTNDQSTHAADYQPLIVAYRNNAPIRLSDLGDIEDSVSDLRNEGLANGKPAVLVIIFRQPGANILTTVQGVKAALPHLKAAMPADIDVAFASDRTTTIQASLNDTERTLVIAVVLVTAVVYLFLRNWRFVIIPAVAVPVSVIGTFGAMYLMGFSLDNLSLMALTIATGFVVDDAIVVLENIARHIEDGMDRREAALTGAREISYTIITITISLIAVFLPILLMGGIIGRLFQEFALTLSLAILISMVISLTTTPMMCALLLRPTPKADASAPEKKTWSDRLRDFYGRTLGWALEHSLIVAMMLVATVGLTVFLYIVIPKGFFPQEDTGRLTGAIQADQSISFQAMSKKLAQTMSIVDHDPAVENVVGFTGSGSGGGGNAQTNTGSVYISLKDESKRDGLNAVLSRLRKKLAVVTGSRLYLQPVQDIRVGGRQSNATYQYTLQGDTTAEVYGWAPKLLAELQKEPILTDVNSDQQQGGLETDITIDRKTSARLGLNMSQIDNLLYDAFGQRQVATLYEAQNQYHVVMEAAPRYWQDPSTLSMIYISTSGGSASGTQTTALSPGTISASATTTGGGGAAAGIGAISLNACGAGSAKTTGIGASTYQTASTSALASLNSNSPTATTAVLTNASNSISTIPALPTATLASQTVGAAGASCVELNAGGGSASSGTSTGSSPSTSTPSASPTATAGSTSSGSGNAEAGSSAVNASENSLASTGHGSASSGSAVSTGSETMVPLSAIAKVAAGNTPLAVNHQSQYVSATISFNLAAGKSLSDAVSAITAAKQRIGMPDTVKGIFAGTAQAFQQSLDTEPMLVGAALIAVYIVLGILYESYIHPITILSTLPSAGLGALLALLLFHLEFTIISLIGVILLIGIVKKNAILMIDFAIHAQREQNITARDAIHQAALLRMRPILMTTLAAMFGAVPLAIAFGVGSELRQPLGISIVGGLAVSQILTLYTTPVIYLYLDRLRAWLSGEKR